MKALRRWTHRGLEEANGLSPPVKYPTSLAPSALTLNALFSLICKKTDVRFLSVRIKRPWYFFLKANKYRALAVEKKCHFGW